MSLLHSYAKIHIPIIASVSEHQPTTWVSFFFDLHILVCTFPAGLWFCIRNINDERVFGKLTSEHRHVVYSRGPEPGSQSYHQNYYDDF